MKKKLIRGISLDREKVRKIWMTMRLIVLLFFVSLMHLSASVYSQKTKVNLKVENATLQQVFQTIQDQTEFDFFYKNEQIPAEARVSIQYQNESVEVILDKILSGTGLTYHVLDKDIVISAKGAAKSEINGQQQKSVSGKITDSSGSPLPGVSVVVKGTTNGTISDANGNYSISNIPENATLQFSFVGMKAQEVVVGGKSTVNVKMEEDAIGIEEVVAVGYGTVKKGELTVSVSQVKATELRDIPVSSIDQALAGRATGVSVVQGTGGPGANTSIRIRGSNSINSSAEPLIVVDGLPLSTTSGDNSSSSRYGFTGDQINVLASINPNDIETVDILKDAAATSIYGARGANGVILITTKKGKQGKTSLSLNSYYGVQQISKSMEMLDATEFSKLIFDARANSKLVQTTNPDLLSRKMALPDTYNTDWLSEVSRIAPIQDYNLNLNGGNENGKYLISLGHFSQDGVIKATEIERYSARLNLESSALNNRIKLGVNFSLARTQSQMLNTASIYSNALFAAPNLPVYDSNEYYTYNLPDFFNDGYSYPNFLRDYRLYTVAPMYNIEKVKAPRINDRIFGNLFLDLKLMEGLTYKLNVGADVNHNKIKFFSPEIGQMRYGTGAANDLSHLMNNTYTIDNTINYLKTIGLHNLTVLLGQSGQKYTNETVGFTASNLNNFYTFWGNPDNGWAMDGDNFNTGGKYSSYSDWKFTSYFARLNYNYSDKYLFTATYTRDGSSKFGSNKKWGNFPGISAAWIASNEEFLKRASWIDVLRFRAGYGVTGNSNLQNYLSIFVMTNIGAPIGGYYKPAFAPRALADKNLAWESTGQFNIGADITLFNRRLNSTIDIYNKHTWDMIDALEISYASGFNSIRATNIGEMKGKGIEISIAYDILKKTNFNWNSRINLSHERTKITKLADEKDYIGNHNGDIRSYINQPLGQFYGYKVAGLFQENDDIKASAQPNASPGDYKYLDWNGYDAKGEFTNQPDGQINDADRMMLGSALPDLTFSWTNSLKYKNWDFTAYINGIVGVSVYNEARWAFLSLNGANNNSIEALKRWTPDNPNTMIQRAAQIRLNAKDGQLNSEFIEDASYARLSSVVMGYTHQLRNTTFAQNVRIYCSAQNLLVFTNYSGVDPEVSGDGLVNRGIDSNRYPKTKTILIGLNINF